MTDAATVDRKKSSSSSELFTQISGKRKAVDKFATVIIYFAMALALVPLLWVLIKVLSEGLPAILNPDWWVYDWSASRVTRPVVVQSTPSSVP